MGFFEFLVFVGWILGLVITVVLIFFAIQNRLSQKDDFEDRDT
mgnify:CR=1 FL=1|jgi:hypothetical protein|uniref:Uncharacterized protein n=1 Tax=uncultured marine bacterium 580 TaxID=257400 RepID=Q6SFM4_9BACT|nr:hypothetical protein MBMO_EBAC000-36A07.33 [uncultured marine bacterium 580]|tara:strand:+ start:520 stop:648 length:129 start_codon:yes stop_codon:yes gene_type:complete